MKIGSKSLLQPLAVRWMRFLCAVIGSMYHAAALRSLNGGMNDMKNMFGKMGNRLGQQGAGMLAMKEMRKNMRRFK